ncbi:MAG: glycosyltransferase, partial [Deltaproteobacteria bacterium]|nr:glycosyltransferase [Deltaproteobacteria bacterium]
MKVVILLNRPALSAEMEKRLLTLVDHVHTPDGCSAPIHRKIRNAAKRWFSKRTPPETESKKIRANLGSDYLGQATGILCRKYSPRAVVAQYVFATPCLREVPPGVLKIVDTHGVFSRRRPEDPTYCSREEERSYLLNADLVLAIQGEEADCFRSLVPERKVVTVGVDYEIAGKDPAGGEQGNTVMVVGTNYSANVAGLKGFCEHAWPIVRRENPLAELLVAGKIREAIDVEIPHVKVLGWVDDLQALYRLSSVVINPTMTGVGLKIKTIEALCNGKALVATPNAVEGLPFRGDPPCMVCGNWPE